MAGFVHRVYPWVLAKLSIATSSMAGHGKKPEKHGGELVHGDYLPPPQTAKILQVSRTFLGKFGSTKQLIRKKTNGCFRKWWVFTRNHPFS